MTELSYICTYRSGEVITNLNYDDSYALFLEASKTNNPCVVTFDQKILENN